jgi:hypothetical protein
LIQTVLTAAAQHRLHEAYFVAIVTPATKQFETMLADMSHRRALNDMKWAGPYR